VNSLVKGSVQFVFYYFFLFLSFLSSRDETIINRKESGVFFFYLLKVTQSKERNAKRVQILRG